MTGCNKLVDPAFDPLTKPLIVHVRLRFTLHLLLCEVIPGQMKTRSSAFLTGIPMWKIHHPGRTGAEYKEPAHSGDERSTDVASQTAGVGGRDSAEGNEIIPCYNLFRSFQVINRLTEVHTWQILRGCRNVWSASIAFLLEAVLPIELNLRV